MSDLTHSSKTSQPEQDPERHSRRGARVTSALVSLGALLVGLTCAMFVGSRITELVATNSSPPPPRPQAPKPAATVVPANPSTPAPVPTEPLPRPRPQIEGMDIFQQQEPIDLGIIRYEVTTAEFGPCGTDDESASVSDSLCLYVRLRATNIDKEPRSPDSKFKLLDEDLDEYEMDAGPRKHAFKVRLNPRASRELMLVYEVPPSEPHTYYLRVTSDKGIFSHEKRALVELSPNGSRQVIP